MECPVSDLEWSWRSLQLFETFLKSEPYILGKKIQHVLATVCLHANQKMYTRPVVSTVLSKFETRGPLKVTGIMYTVKVVISRKRCMIATCHYVATNDKKWCTAYRIASFPITLSDFQGHEPNASLLRCDFSYSCAAVDKISTDIARRAVPATAELLVICSCQGSVLCSWLKKVDFISTKCTVSN